MEPHSCQLEILVIDSSDSELVVLVDLLCANSLKLVLGSFLVSSFRQIGVNLETEMVEVHSVFQLSSHNCDLLKQLVVEEHIHVC